ncbi:MAG: hypothetical protein PG981_000776 [Wolbachia endosymbiont of Ctenocephalides orientis wCori]|nr:MAG: hypothetical protein PG981_000776 [Wolbachia endosymbiont of Ctenocephalides orientis wCori]
MFHQLEEHLDFEENLDPDKGKEVAAHCDAYCDGQNPEKHHHTFWLHDFSCIHLFLIISLVLHKAQPLF